MKIIINERQLRTIIESENKISEKKLRIYKDTIDFFGLDYAVKLFNKEVWKLIEMGVVKSCDEDLDLRDTPIKSLGNLKSVGGDLDLYENTKITSLGNLESVGFDLNLSYTELKDLGSLEYVGGDLDLYKSKITSLGELKYVGGYLNLNNTPLGKELKDSGMSIDDIKNKIEVKGEIYL